MSLPDTRKKACAAKHQAFILYLSNSLSSQEHRADKTLMSVLTDRYSSRYFPGRIWQGGDQQAGGQPGGQLPNL
jgi:hypothetical protein